MTATNEAARLAAVRRYKILATPPDGTFDRITSLAATFFNVPYAVVSIVDHDRIWFKSRYGVATDQIGRDPGLCSSAILRDDPTIIGDTKLDPHCLTNPLVAGEFGLRFYAAAPLITADGHRLGTLCVMDKQPREVSAGEAKVLESLAGVIMDELEIRLAAREMTRSTLNRYDLMIEKKSHAEQRLRHSFDSAPIGMAVLSLDYIFLEVNAAFCAMLGYREGDLLLSAIADHMHPDDLEACLTVIATLSSGQQRTQKTDCRFLSALGVELCARMNLSSTVEGFDEHPTRIIAQVEVIAADDCETVVKYMERPKVSLRA